MKTKYTILTLLFSFFCLTMQAQTFNYNETNTILVSTAYVNNASMTWNVTSSVSNKPLLITYSIGTETNCDWVTIRSVDNSGVYTQLLRISGTQSGTISTVIPNGKAQITFTSDYSICYASNPSIYSGINISFAVDNSSTTNQNSYTSGNSITNGKLGIGGAPTQSLTVKGGKVAIQDVGATVSDEGYTGSLMITKPATSGQYINMVRQGLMPWSIGMVYNTNTFAIGQGTSSDASFSNPFFNLTNTGKVGIGTTNPNAKIESVSGVNAYPVISGITQSGAALRLRGADNAVLDFGLNGTNTWIQATDQLNLALNYNISLNPNGGNVGIGTGTTAPIAKLDVSGNARVTNDFTVLGSGTDIGGCINILNTAKTGAGQASKWTILNMSGSYGNSLQFWAYDNIGCASGGMCAPRLALMDNGNIIAAGKIGIGLTDAATKLAASPTDELLTVNGTIHAKEVKVDLTGTLADFVFSPSYKLMPLHKVEEYVNANNHLPEIPSAAEVSKNGMNMGDMQNKLLQKVEELTLYVIEQQKQIEELKKNQK